MKTLFIPLFSLLVFLQAPAFGQELKNPGYNGEYWQRIHVADAAYQQGAGAQDMLNRNIATCAAEVQVLEKLGSIEKSSRKPAGKRAYDNRATPPPPNANVDIDGDFHDFESCMILKGWERVEFIPYGTADAARRNFFDNHVGYEEKRVPGPNDGQSPNRSSGDVEDIKILTDGR